MVPAGIPPKISEEFHASISLEITGISPKLHFLELIHKFILNNFYRNSLASFSIFTKDCPGVTPNVILNICFEIRTRDFIQTFFQETRLGILQGDFLEVSSETYSERTTKDYFQSPVLCKPNIQTILLLKNYSLNV